MVVPSSRTLQVNVNTEIGLSVSDLPDPTRVPQGTQFFGRSDGSALVCLANAITGVHEWRPIGGSGIIGGFSLFKFSGGISVSDAGAHTVSLADDGEKNADTAPGARVYTVPSTTNFLSVRADIITNTSDTPSHIVVLEDGVAVMTIDIAPGFTGPVFDSQAQVFNTGSSIEVRLVKDAGGGGGAQIIDGTVIVTLNS